MRVTIAHRVAIFTVLSFTVGCTMPTMSNPFKKLSFRGKGSAASSSSAIASAPTAPAFNSATAAAPQVSMNGAVQTSGNMPVYPGTTYPVTPYPASATPSAVASNSPTYPAYPAYPATAQAPPAVTQPANPYVAANPAAPYAPQQNGPYDPAATPAAPYNAAPAATYTR